MSVDFKKIAADFWGSQPSPHEPSLTNAEFPQAVKLATKFKFGGHASATEASMFWRQFKQMNESLAQKGKDPIGPEEAGHLLDQIAPVSFAYHGRPPSMKELANMSDQTPKQVRDYFSSLPDKHYPDVTAGEMVKALVSATPWANEHLSRDALKNEARYLHHSGEAPNEYYSRLAQSQSVQPAETQGAASSQPAASPNTQQVQQGGVQASAQRNGRTGSPGNAGRQPPGQ